MFRPDPAQQPHQSPHSPYLSSTFWTLLTLIALTAAIRLPGIARPLLGNFATKNVVYAMIARNWAEANASVWNPTLDVLRGDGRAWHMLEFPVSAYLTAGLWKAFGGSLDVWGRATAVAFSVASVVLMFLFVRRRHGRTAAAAAAFALALSPLGVIYGQSFMLEASLVFFTLGTFDALDRWLDGGRAGWLATAGVCLALLLLTKIYMLVLLLPLCVMAFRSDRLPRSSTRGLLAATLLLAMLPAACWYAFAYHTASPEGPFAERIYFSVRHSAADHLPPHPLLASADFYRRSLDNLTGVVLTPIGFTLALAGLCSRRWRQYAAWLLAMVVLVLLLPRKFHEMNYYYMAALPPLCVMIGLGWQVIRRRVRSGRTTVAVLVLAAILLSLRYSVRPAFVTPEEDRAVPAAARAVRELTAEDEPIVTVHGTTIDLLYYCNRPGWAIDPKQPRLETVLADCRRRGARYVVIVGEAPILQGLVFCGDNYRIHRLSAPAQ